MSLPVLGLEPVIDSMCTLHMVALPRAQRGGQSSPRGRAVASTLNNGNCLARMSPPFEAAFSPLRCPPPLPQRCPRGDAEVPESAVHFIADREYPGSWGTALSPHSLSSANSVPPAVWPLTVPLSLCADDQGGASSGRIGRAAVSYHSCNR